MDRHWTQESTGRSACDISVFLITFSLNVADMQCFSDFWPVRTFITPGRSGWERLHVLHCLCRDKKTLSLQFCKAGPVTKKNLIQTHRGWDRVVEKHHSLSTKCFSTKEACSFVTEDIEAIHSPGVQRNLILFQGFCVMKYAIYALCVNAHKYSSCGECECIQQETTGAETDTNINPLSSGKFQIMLFPSSPVQL